MPSRWRHYLEGLHATPPHDPGGSILVLSAHPDDEVLAVGAWLVGQTGRDVTFVTATDGEASHPGSPSVTPEQLRARRPLELVRALAALGFHSPQIHRLGLPDGALADHGAALATALAPLVAAADLVLAPFEHDGHPDHDALGAAAVRLCDGHTPIWRFPVWTWAWTEPDAQPWLDRIRRLDCSSTARMRKRRAISAFTSQVRPLSDHPADLAVVEHALLEHASYAPEAIVI